jgi:hypothetical protein
MKRLFSTSDEKPVVIVAVALAWESARVPWWLFANLYLLVKRY